MLFVNGIPVVVVECKSPATSEPMPTAIDQLRRYSNQRKAAGEVDEDEGAERLFHTNQFVVATSYDEARVGTISAEAEHYAEWKDTAPVPMDEVQAELGKDHLSSQNKLIAGMLRPGAPARHHPALHAVPGGLWPHRSRSSAATSSTAPSSAPSSGCCTARPGSEDGEHDRRGGIVWHTQGSGKSLTMVFLVRKMRSSPELRRFKVVVVTDRKDLQKQLSDTLALTGETVRIGKRVKQVKALLAEKGPGVVFAMIQKYTHARFARRASGLLRSFRCSTRTSPSSSWSTKPTASHTNALHANLLKALPNCARIGFTGTPIIMGDKKRTHEIFGEFIDRYTITQSEADGATVPILYEGRTAKGAVSDGRDLDEFFDDMFHEKSQEELEAIKRKYATKGNVLEAQKLIEAKARDMLRHYVEFILPNGLKAQVVAYSRLAAVRYHTALREARDELVEEALALDERTRRLEDDRAKQASRDRCASAVRAWRNLDLLTQIEFAPIISPDNNDDPGWKEWTDASKIESRIARFKKPLVDSDPKRRDPLAFLIVKSMLLTGFDAPIEGVMYLDRSIREAELLQAIARVNRTGRGKSRRHRRRLLRRRPPPEGGADGVQRRGHRGRAAEPQGRDSEAARPPRPMRRPLPESRESTT